MATKTYTVKTYATAAAPRSARLRALGTGAATAAAAPSGSAGDGHGHPNKAFLDTLGDDIAAAEDGAAATRRIYLDASGTAYIEYNADTGCLVCSVPIASRGDVAAFSGGEVPDSGGTTGGGTGGTAYSRLDAWADYDAAKAGYVLSALLGADLDTRAKANAEAIASLADAMAALASAEWVRTALAAYLKKAPGAGELPEASAATFALVLDALDGTVPVKAVDLTMHPVPLAAHAAEAGHADKAALADKATAADSAANADSATSAAEADHAAAADKATALSAKRKVYGQDFDGTGDVDGALTLTGANNGLGLWGTSVDLQVVCTTSAGIRYKAGTKAWCHSTFHDGNTYFWTEDGDTKTHIGTYSPSTGLLLLTGQLRANKGYILQEGEKLYLTHNKTAWLRYDASRGVIVANKPIVTAGDVAAFDTQAE